MIPVLLVFKNWALLLLRLSVGVIFLFRGWQNLKNFPPKAPACNALSVARAGRNPSPKEKKNDEGFARMDSKLVRTLGTVLILFEIFGGFLILAGIYTQIIALLFALEMLAVMVWKIIKRHKFSGGYEFELLLIAANLILATMGGGLFAFLF